jgi:hypothetical protein
MAVTVLDPAQALDSYVTVTQSGMAGSKRQHLPEALPTEELDPFRRRVLTEYPSPSKPKSTLAATCSDGVAGGIGHPKWFGLGFCGRECGGARRRTIRRSRDRRDGESARRRRDHLEVPIRNIMSSSTCRVSPDRRRDRIVVVARRNASRASSPVRRASTWPGPTAIHRTSPDDSPARNAHKTASPSCRCRRLGRAADVGPRGLPQPGAARRCRGP